MSPVSCEQTRRAPKAILAALCALGLLWVGVPRAVAQKPSSGDAGSSKRTLTLDQCVQIAVKNNAEIKERQAGVAGARAMKSQADAARYPQIDGLALLGPSPRARGNQVDSPDDQDNLIVTGAFARGIFSVIQPIFTFGEISGLRSAAASNIKVESAKVDQKAGEIITKVKEYYYGYLLARDLLSLVEEVKGEFDSAKEKVRKALARDAEWANEIDLYKLEAFSSTVESAMAQALKSVRLAMGALKFTMGLPGDRQIKLADAHIIPDVSRVEKLPFYQERSLKLRPEFRQIREGLKALRSLVKVERSKYFPKLFVGALLDVAEATNRDELNNPFVIDPLNHETGGVAVGFKWHFDFGIAAGRISEARAEVQKVMHKRTFALQGIPLEIRKAHEEFLEAEKNIKSTKNSYKFAKKWLVASIANFDLGIGEAEEIFKALEQYAKTRAENYKQIYAYNMAIANLDRTSGLAMRYINKSRK